MRINKYLAACGLGSRRKCEEFVTTGRVCLNGNKVLKLATEVNADDFVTVDGNLVSLPHGNVYLMLNKPKGYVTTVSDDKGRKTVMELIKVKSRVFPVGRLDYDSEGLLLMTDDGDLANHLTHPKNEVQKVYSVRIEGELTKEEQSAIRSGVTFDGIKYKGAKLIVEYASPKESKVTIKVTEGKNHEVRRIFAATGHMVKFLKRVAIGELTVGGLDRGEWRYLRENEINYLKSLAKNK